jgi:hypothetical protein
MLSDELATFALHRTARPQEKRVVAHVAHVGDVLDAFAERRVDVDRLARDAVRPGRRGGAPGGALFVASSVSSGNYFKYPSRFTRRVPNIL